MSMRNPSRNSVAAQPASARSETRKNRAWSSGVVSCHQSTEAFFVTTTSMIVETPISSPVMNR